MGSTTVTTAGSVVEGSRAYYPYGAQRSASGTLRTDRTFTGQKADGTGLLYYNARYYDPALGTFISPDSLVPDAGMVVDYNRFLYARGNPMKYGDPSGYASVEWEAMNNWYNARGWFHNSRSKHWDIRGNPRIRSRQNAEEVLGDAGIVKLTGFTDDSELILLAEGIARFAQTIGNLNNLKGPLGEIAGLARLKVLTMNSVTWKRLDFGPLLCLGGPACVIGSEVSFHDRLFVSSEDHIRATAVHEMAHVIHNMSCAAIMGMDSSCLDKLGIGIGVGFHLPGWGPGGPKHYDISGYGNTNQWEYWAEAVTDWVYGMDYSPNDPQRNPIYGAQRSYLRDIFYDPNYDAMQYLTVNQIQ
ncbi:RHS repeat-associated core domain-containing protein [Candidatus Poribacteria bacterium]|nr:RHS repeat-associated core domain-containing protein [Candidatus Poribacteria bacterium]